MEEKAQQLLHSLRKFRKLADINLSFNGYKRSEIIMLFIIHQENNKNEKEITISQLSSALKITSPSVTQVINVLEKDGVVKRINDKEDGRIVRIALTEKGASLTKEILQKIEEKYIHLVQYLGDKKSDQLISLLQEVSDYFVRNKWDETN
ncbi:MarR family winged helix-turn-helix transcriptional regulator [Niallia nealsonii]|uniref:Transcriptional regulator n=1 Tax=Niallia nealsonii TaxID=115979 RepID=A0A2N0Z246_9BACI|nr:MarR family transcriptional regulator [Niallia nealsonii]PKG23567.1 transcriptional regulator [Niallia nealsonii]